MYNNSASNAPSENLSGLALYDWDNLLLAYHKAAKGKRGHADVAEFEYRLEENLLQLQQELKEQTYQPGQYHSFYIHDPKKRLISAAPFRDRVVHHALCNLIEPIFEKSFISDSYANRVGKGTHKAIDRAQQFARRFKYVLTCDIRQYFPSIDHEILLTTLYRKLQFAPGCDLQCVHAKVVSRIRSSRHPRRRVTRESCAGDGAGSNLPDMFCVHNLQFARLHNLKIVVRSILQSGMGVLQEEYDMVYFEGDDPSTGSGQGLFAANRPRGLPIGNLTSQFWANCYLDPFDHFVKRNLQCKGYVRYVDDFLLFSNDKAELNEWRLKIIAELAKLRLTLHETKCQPRPVAEGIPFLGFVVFPEHRLLKRRKGIAFQRKYRKLRKDHLRGEISLERINASIQGWVNHVRYANTWRLRLSILAH
ncbi:hypothetical protein FBQ83_15325 [Chloroflexi bacterium CFX5]|nr:hypothetical protein [Chloroflexi bacterium CFX5]